MILIVSKYLARVTTIDLARELVRRFLLWIITEIEVRAEIIVAKAKLKAYAVGLDLDAVVAPREAPARR